MTKTSHIVRIIRRSTQSYRTKREASDVAREFEAPVGYRSSWVAFRSVPESGWVFEIDVVPEKKTRMTPAPRKTSSGRTTRVAATAPTVKKRAKMAKRTIVHAEGGPRGCDFPTPMTGHGGADGPGTHNSGNDF